MRTGARSCWRGTASRRPCGASSPSRISSRSIPATLQVSPGNEAHLHAFATEAFGRRRRAQPLYLHTSPEFACKKLLAAGEPRISCFAHVYRNRERGPLHHPEFTMLEWYRAGEPYEALMRDCAEMLALAAETAGTQALTFRGRETDPFQEPERLTVAEAFWRFAGIDLLATIDTGRCNRRAAARGRAEGGRPARSGRRHLVRPLQPRHRRAGRAAAGPWPRHDPRRIPGRRGGARPADRPRSAGGGAVRALCLRRRTRECLRRIDGCRPSSAAGSRRRWRRRCASMAKAIR